MNKQIDKPYLASAVGIALMSSLALAGNAQADGNPFGVTELNGGYMQIAMNEGKCGEGKCGGEKH